MGWGIIAILTSIALAVGIIYILWCKKGDE